MLEKMDKFFENRIDSYDEHMMTNIESADEFYPFTARQLPMSESAYILDLGCGTGLELGEYFSLNPSAKVMGIDLSKGMLDVLKTKFPDKDVTLICNSYFDENFGENIFDAAVSVESLHHFEKGQKIQLYKRLCKSLKEGGYFILTDYFSLSDKEEAENFETLKKLKQMQKITDNDLYHYDTPLTVNHEIEALMSGGFRNVQILGSWGATYTLKADK